MSDGEKEPQPVVRTLFIPDINVRLPENAAVDELIRVSVVIETTSGVYRVNYREKPKAAEDVDPG